MNISTLKAKKLNRKKAALLLIGLVGIWCWRVQLLEIISLIGDRDAIVEFLRQYGLVGPVVLFVILMLQVFLAIIPGHAFMVAGGYIYGLVVGVLITQVSTVIASQLAFYLSRQFGRPLVDRMARANVVDRWNQLAAAQGGLFFFFAFILPIFPNDLMCFIAGLSAISPRKFFIANFLGRLPCAVFVTLIGSHGLEMPLAFWMVIALVILGLGVLWKFISTHSDQRFFTKISTANC